MPPTKSRSSMCVRVFMCPSNVVWAQGYPPGHFYPQSEPEHAPYSAQYQRLVAGRHMAFTDSLRFHMA